MFIIVTTMVRVISFVTIAAALTHFTDAFAPNVANTFVKNNLREQTPFRVVEESKNVATSTSLIALSVGVCKIFLVRKCSFSCS